MSKIEERNHPNTSICDIQYICFPQWLFSTIFSPIILFLHKGKDTTCHFTFYFLQYLLINYVWYLYHFKYCKIAH